MHDVAQAAASKFSTMKPTTKKVVKAILAVFALFVILAAIKGLQIFTMISAKPPMPLETVTSAQVKEEDWAPLLSAVGSISPVQGAMVSTELPGTVAQIGFES